MSRCYPFPPPGYQKEKKDHVELGLSPKKEKHKHKDKKKKKRKDSETNGELSSRDNEKRSKKSQPPGGTNEGTSLPNGKSEAKATSSGISYENTIPKVQTEKPREKLLPDGLQVTKTEPDTKVNNQTPTISIKAPSHENGEASKGIVPAAKLEKDIKISQKEDELSIQRHAPFVPRIEKVFSTVDDQEWLYICDGQLQQASKKKLEEVEIPQVWAESVLLPSVNVYALPYVVPD